MPLPRQTLSLTSLSNIRLSPRSCLTPTLSVQRSSSVHTIFRKSRIVAPNSNTIRTYASQDYGSGKGDPKGENPLEQGPNPSADVEHPGPPPPSAGQGSGSGPTKGTTGGHNSGNSSSASSSGQGQKGGSGSGSSGKGAQPKILRDTLPAEPDEDVKQHNREMNQRADRAHEKAEDNVKVPKGYWSGKSSFFYATL